MADAWLSLGGLSQRHRSEHWPPWRLVETHWIPDLELGPLGVWDGPSTRREGVRVKGSGISADVLIPCVGDRTPFADISTSWFASGRKIKARENGRIQLIEGSELVHLVKEHLHKDVLVAPPAARSRVRHQ